MSTSKTKKIEVEEITADDLDNKNMKVRVNCWVDGDIILELRKRAKAQGTKYQTLLNQSLRERLFDDQNVETRLERLENIVLKKAK